MSPGNTMLRVYAELKSRIMAGTFPPGARLDPGRLATGLAASRTPVRDALLQLSGERLVDSWEQEGFRIPLINEPMIRDLYEWTNDVVHVVIRSGMRRATPEDRRPPTGESDYVKTVAHCFLLIGDQSSNREHRVVIGSLNDRMAAIRRTEAIVLEGADTDLVAIEAAIMKGDWPDVGRTVDLFHRRRIRMVAEIAASMRPREPLRP